MVKSKINKRGLSAVVTTLIIILLVLVAVGVIWVVMKNILSGGAEEIFLGKFTIDLKVKNVNLDNSTNNISLRVKRNPGQGDLAGIKFIFNDGVNSEVFEEMDLTLEELGERGFVFTLIQLNINDILTISIAPIYKTASGKTIIGRIISTYKVKEGGYCIANCTGKVCGSDGCGGSCPPGCGDGESCIGGACEIGLPDCTLDSASWSVVSVVEGTPVNLIVVGTGADCADIDLNYSIYENDPFVDDYVISYVEEGLTYSWTSFWTYLGDDDIGEDPRDYYVVATIVDNPIETITSSDPKLAVSKALTCIEAGGTCMANPCATYTDCSSLVGTCVTGTCCSGTCTASLTSYVTRSFSSSTVSAGSSIDVTILGYAISNEDYYAIEEYIPSGWSTTAETKWVVIDDTLLDATEITWLEANVPNWQNIFRTVETTSRTYTIQAPASTGTYAFDGVYMFEPFYVPTPVCGNGICEISDDFTINEQDPSPDNTEYCPQDCYTTSTQGETTVTVV